MKLLTLRWVGTMQRYLALRGEGIPMLPVSYETLVSQPEAALRAIFEYCGLTVEGAGRRGRRIFRGLAAKHDPVTRTRGSGNVGRFTA